jgi:hypothetical protein
MKATRNGGGEVEEAGLQQNARVLAVEIPGIDPGRRGSVTSVHENGRVNVSFFPRGTEKNADFIRDLLPSQVRLCP